MHWLTLLVLFLVYTAYLFFGAAIFQSLESGNEQKVQSKPTYKIRDLIENASFTAGNSSIIDQTKIEALVLTAIEAYDHGLLEVNNTKYTKSEEDLNYLDALFLCVTIITTVGYGHITPKTPGGQVFCIFYALIGIPTTGVLLIELGRKIAAPIKKFRKRSKSTYKRILKSVVIITVLLSVMVFVPSLIYRETEGWSMLEAVYFNVITFTTVGFGDYVVDHHKDNSQYSVIYQLLSNLWIFVSLSLASAIVSDISDNFTARVKRQEDTVRGKSRNISTTENNSDSENASRINYI